MSYHIVAGSAIDVDTEVQNLLSVGFELHGSVSVLYVPGGTYYLHYSQPMYHPKPNLIKQLSILDIASGEQRLVRLAVVYNSVKLEELLKNNARLHNKKSHHWMHCKLLNDKMSEDIFVLNEKYAFNELNMEQALNLIPQKKDNLVRNITVRFMANGEKSNIDVVPEDNSSELEDLLEDYKYDKSRWVHYKLADDMSQDIFVLDDTLAFNKLNMAQGFGLSYPTKFDGGRRHKTSRRRL
jgi:hypothetical protein